MTTANVQPIYIGTPINWELKLASQVTPRLLNTESPTLLGTFGDNGGLIWNIRCLPLGVNVATVLRLYGLKSGVTGFSNASLLFETTLAAVASVDNVSAVDEVEVVMPRIYTKESSTAKGFTAVGGYSIYAGLGTAVASGWQILVNGGNY